MVWLPLPLVGALAVRDWVVSCSRGKLWWARLPLEIYFVWLLVRFAQDPAYASLLSGLNLGIHEFGHLIFGPLGEWWGIAGGTLTQLAIPLVSVGMFIKQEDAFALSFSGVWLGANLLNVAVYAADARAMAIPLVSPGGGEVYHDWNYLLDAAGLLAQDQAVGAAFRGAGYLALAAGVAWGAWVLWEMARK